MLIDAQYATKIVQMMKNEKTAPPHMKLFYKLLFDKRNKAYYYVQSVYSHLHTNTVENCHTYFSLWLQILQSDEYKKRNKTFTQVY